MFLYRKSWNSISSPKFVNTKDIVSVVVACRNEESNIVNLIRDIKSQNFDTERFELIIVNDHSTDATLLVLEQESKNWSHLKIVNLEVLVIGKKNAIRKGVEIAKGEIIVCTDADCRIGEEWIQTISNYFIDKNIKFVSGPVIFKSSLSWFSKFQTFEIFSLVAASASAINRNKSTICNGANLSFRKKEYLEIKEDLFNNFKTDDVDLLQYFKKEYKNAIKFIKDRDAIIFTEGNPNLISNLKQKIRWISSSKSICDWDSFFVAILVFLMNLILVISFFLFIYFLFYKNESDDYGELLILFRVFFLLVFLFIYLIKYVSDYLLLKDVFKFFGRRELLVYLFPFEIINAIYTVVIVPLSFLFPVKWKGRKL